MMQTSYTGKSFFLVNMVFLVNMERLLQIHDLVIHHQSARRVPFSHNLHSSLPVVNHHDSCWRLVFKCYKLRTK